MSARAANAVVVARSGSSQRPARPIAPVAAPAAPLTAPIAPGPNVMPAVARLPARCACGPVVATRDSASARCARAGAEVALAQLPDRRARGPVVATRDGAFGRRALGGSAAALARRPGRRAREPVETALARLRCAAAFALLAAAACGSSPTAPVAPAPAPPPVVELVDAPRRGTPDPSLFADPPPALLAGVDWSQPPDAVWRQIAPTGADYESKLVAIPEEHQRALAIALLNAGNIACAAPPAACAKVAADVPAPADAATLDDPCLRRVLALWAISALDPADLPAVAPALDRIASLPPPESQLLAAVLKTVPDDQQDRRLALLSLAWRAGQRDVVNASLDLDEPHLIRAVREAHIDGALEVLAVEQSRPTYLAALKDETLGTAARVKALDELVASADPMGADVRAAVIGVTKSKDCAVAAAAARALEVRGDKRFVPRRPSTNNVDLLMRGLCVLASYEPLQRSDEPSLLPSYLPARGLERYTFTEDPTVDDSQKAELVARADAVLPEIEDLARAMRRCRGTVCASDDREYRFAWKAFGGQTLLSRIELADRPPCKP